MSHDLFRVLMLTGHAVLTMHILASLVASSVFPCCDKLEAHSSISSSPSVTLLSFIQAMLTIPNFVLAGRRVFWIVSSLL